MKAALRCLLTVAVCSRVWLAIVATDSGGLGVAGASASVVQTTDEFSEDTTDHRGVALLRMCQGKRAYLRVEFGEIVQTYTVLSTTDSAFRVTLDIWRQHLPAVFRSPPAPRELPQYKNIQVPFEVFVDV